jgi:hypothetical protein
MPYSPQHVVDATVKELARRVNAEVQVPSVRHPSSHQMSWRNFGDSWTALTQNAYLNNAYNHLLASLRPHTQQIATHATCRTYTSTVLSVGWRRCKYLLAWIANELTGLRAARRCYCKRVCLQRRRGGSSARRSPTCRWEMG